MQGKINIALIAVCSGMALAGPAAVWQKDFATWTEKDAHVLVSNSPWAKQMAMPIAGRPDMVVLDPQEAGSVTPSAALGNPANTTSAPAGNGHNESDPNAARGSNSKAPSGMPPAQGAPEMQPVVTILWASAAPVRLALLKLRNGTTPPTDEEITNAEKPRANYVMAVSGFPAPEAGSDPKSLAKGAFLTVHGKPPVVSTESDYRKVGNSDVYFFRFPRTSLDISQTDQQVEFRLKMGKIEIKRKFDLGGMTYQGQLAL